MPSPAGPRPNRRTGGAALGRLRLCTGLVLATFVTGHLSNHALGVVSIDAQEALREVLSPIWQSWPGTIALYFALLVHPCLGLYGLWRRRTLQMPPWELAQLVLGLAIPLLLMPHVFATRIASTLMVVDTSYPAVVAGLWSSAQSLVRQPLLVVVVWGHLMIGLHYWLRLRAGYRRAFPLLVAIAMLLPTLALLGFVGAAEELRARDELERPASATVEPERETLERWKSGAYATYASLLALVLAMRVARRKF
jgi:adenylate cyclase